MARWNTRKKDNMVFHIDPANISFSLFTTEDILKLSVKKIYTPLTFNSLGHPLPGGLYDPALGPLGDKNNVCQTCSETVDTCPGHLGHIDLPVAVINPLFFKKIAALLHKSCIICFRLQIDDTQKKCLQMKLRLVDSGYLNEAQELSTPNKDERKNPHCDEMIEFENKLIFYEKLLENDNSDLSHNKNTESLRNDIISAGFKEMDHTMNSTKEKCCHCNNTLSLVKCYQHKLMKKEKVEESDGEERTITSFILADECRTYLRSLWVNESTLISELFPVLKKCNLAIATDIFFFEVLPVPPPNIRPVNILNGKMVENPQTQVYKTILECCLVIRAIMSHMKQTDESEILDSTQAVFDHSMGATSTEKLHNAWQELQRNIDNLLDKELAKTASTNPVGLGIKQIIEKKEGVIRMHMMGKRVNYAARSVITPDPNLNIDEIGIPEAIAMKLSYPVPVTPWNVSELRKMIMNGPNKHPGAVMVETEDGTQIRIPEDITKQESIAKRLLTPSENSQPGTKIVHRHLCNGDIMVLNRQPTLHKPSIMAHKARILPGEKTLRLHYANCKAYNADFDGDEMNAHFPQNELARSEAYNIANVCNQYLVPKDGTPLSGLIQDHMVSGVRLSLRGKFFNREDYHMLIYQALPHIRGDIKLLPPAIIKPIRLWSGKQVISTLIINCTPKDCVPITLNSTAKISPKAWETSAPRRWLAGGTNLKHNEMSEAKVVISKGELLCGVLDKTHYGATPYGLIHCMYELYGGSYSSKLLSSFAKLFTAFLQREGFTLGVKDILVVKEADKKRTKIIKNSRKIGLAAQASAVHLPINDPEKIKTAVEEAYSSNPKFRVLLDRQYKQALDSYTNDINKTCLPAGLLSKFPYNNLQLMVQSGAKGSTVNTMQISCLLGQIELEGKRPPVMISGKSLPSFPAYESSPRAGGFIDGRFMTGIQPQEFFFHCMAGREGLIDTAVKTSRSGYLQRCLIKHLEGLTVQHDQTVRDSDNSVIQFLYGEDGMDISRVQFLNEKQLQFLCDNLEVIVDKRILNDYKKDPLTKEILKKNKELRRYNKKVGSLLKTERSSTFAKFSQDFQADVDSKSVHKISKKTGRPRIAKRILKLWKETTADEKSEFAKQNIIPDPLTSRYNSAHYFGVLSEKLDSLMENYDSKKNKSEFEDMMRLKATQTLCPPGEPVGLLAAQSIGEPSTQMTLNTFHFAGRGEMNVTLGIPRLREILMTASKTIKTPSMDIPFQKNIPDLEIVAEKLRKRLVKVTVADVLEYITLTRVLELLPAREHKYTIRFHFLPPSAYKSEFCVRPRGILKYMRKHFYRRMLKHLARIQKSGSANVNIEERTTKKRTENVDTEADDKEPNIDNNAGFGEDLQSSDDEFVDEEDARNTKKTSQKKDNGYEDKEQEDEESEKENDDENADPISNIKALDEEDNDDDDPSNAYDGITKDEENHLWCQFVFKLPLSYTKVDFAEALKKIAKNAVIWETPDIKRGFTHQINDELMLKTEGINIQEIFKYDNLLDLNKLYCNDIHGIAKTYGIEAAGRVIVKEVQNVFKVYGITVDPRHLLLISDYMTYDGTFQPLSRKGMAGSASPLQQMSFESSLTFLKEAAIQGKIDDLRSPSSCLMVGQPCSGGTGSVTLKNSFI